MARKLQEECNPDLPQIKVGQLSKEIVEDLCILMDRRRPFRYYRCPMLWGPPGIGKSAIVYESAEELEEVTGKHTRVVEIRLSMFTPMDLLGVPVPGEAVTLSGGDQVRFTEWLRPKIFDLSEDEDVINLIFLDEINAAVPAVQAAAYQLVGDRRVGTYVLPANTVIVAAGNRMVDNGVVYRMPAPLCNRMAHYEVTADYDSWREWAMQHRVDPRVIGYLAFARDKLNRGLSDVDEKAYPTPRSWEAVSDVLSDHPGSTVDDLLGRIASHIGVGEAGAFARWCKLNGKLPATDMIFCGVSNVYPRSQDALYALTEAMLRFVEEHRDTITTAELDNACRYVEKFPADMQMLFYQSLRVASLKHDALAAVLKNSLVFMRWIRMNRQYMEA